MACLQIYRELLSLATFLQVHSNSKEVSYLTWQNSYPNLKATCHFKLKFFLWTKLLERLLLAKYLISVTATLTWVSSDVLRREQISLAYPEPVKQPRQSFLRTLNYFCKKLHLSCFSGFWIRPWILITIELEHSFPTSW